MKEDMGGGVKGMDVLRINPVPTDEECASLMSYSPDILSFLSRRAAMNCQEHLPQFQSWMVSIAFIGGDEN